MRALAAASAPTALAIACLAFLLLAAPAQATVGHDGPEPVPTDLWIHFAGEDVLPMQTLTPSAFRLPPAPGPGVPECGSALSWVAAVTTAPVGDNVTWQGLARDAQFGSAAARLAWFFETVQPGSDEPLALDLPPMRLAAELRRGDDPASFGQGMLLASGAVEAQPTAQDVEGRAVYRMDVALAWSNRTALADTGMHLLIRLDTGPEPCRAAPPAVRAYADPQHAPRLRLDVLEPVRIDLLEPAYDGRWHIVWHASSPWGAADLTSPTPPALLGPGGKAPTPELVRLDDALVLQSVWSWDPEGAPNGTYRIDAAIANAAGTAEATATVLFQVGQTHHPDVYAPVEPRPAKESPGPALLGPVAVLLALGVTQRIRAGGGVRKP